MNHYSLTGPVQRNAAITAVMTAPPNWVVSIGEEKRRDKQNRLFWEVMGDLSRANPEGRQWTKETWRDAIMHALGHQVQFAQSLDNSGPFPIGFRSSKLSVSQMTEVLEFAFHYGTEHGVVFTIDRKRAAEVFRGMAE